MTKVVTFWIKAHQGALPQNVPLQALLQDFAKHFPEYQHALHIFQSPRWPHHVFVCVQPGCLGVLPLAAQHLEHLLNQAFPHSHIRKYGKQLGS